MRRKVHLNIPDPHNDAYITPSHSVHIVDKMLAVSTSLNLTITAACLFSAFFVGDFAVLVFCVPP